MIQRQKHTVNAIYLTGFRRDECGKNNFRLKAYVGMKLKLVRKKEEATELQDERYEFELLNQESVRFFMTVGWPIS